MIGPRRIDKPLVLYGYGRLGKLAEEIFRELKIPIAAIIDKTYRYKAVEEYHRESSLIAVCIASEPYDLFQRGLTYNGWQDIVPVWDIIEAYPEVGIHNGWFAGESSLEDYYAISSVRFDDELSERHYYWGHVQWRRYRTETEGIVPVPAEALPSTLADIRQRQVVFNFEFMPKHVVIHQEGHELQTIIRNMDRLKAFRPSLEVACYHSRDGLYLIQKTLMDNLPDYQWTFRLTAYMGQGAYIYGMPKEKT